jgi:hypothetical protein
VQSLRHSPCRLAAGACHPLRALLTQCAERTSQGQCLASRQGFCCRQQTRQEGQGSPLSLHVCPISTRLVLNRVELET